MQGCEYIDDPEIWELLNFGECVEKFDDLPAHLMSYFESWAEYHMDDPPGLSQDQLAEFIDDMVFSGWDSFQKFDAPEFKYPDIRDMYVRVGFFSKDLPDPKKGQSIFAGTLEDELFAFLAKDEQYSVPAERKEGQAANLRTSVDASVNTIIYHWTDVNGEWAPYDSIEFDSTQGMPYKWTFAMAYRRHDIAWAQACDDWNSRLCVYLCRCDIQAATKERFWDDGNPSALYRAKRRSFWDHSEENQKEYTPEHFVKAPSIRDIWPKMNKNPDEMWVVKYKKPRGVQGRAIFRDPKPS